MEVSGNIFRSITCYPKSYSILGHKESGVCIKSTTFSGFYDDGHEKYNSRLVPTIRSGGGKKKKEKTKLITQQNMKKKMKMIKGLSKDLSIFSEIGYGLDPEQSMVDQVRGKMISEAAELLLGQLQQLKLEEKELKRKKNEEKAKLKAARMQNMNGCESSSLQSSDNDCGEVVDMSCLQTEIFIQPTQSELQPITKRLSALPATSAGRSDTNNTIMGVSGKKIEVCMGGKCKKSGASLLLEEFKNKVGGEGSIVGCKCMGKCRDGPNVRVMSRSINDNGGDEYGRAPFSPLCIGVGLEDVSSIVTNFFGGNHKDLGLAPTS